jgi:PhnB protein
MPVYKPANYNAVSPYLIVRDAAATIEFLKSAFDAVELERVRFSDGKIRHAEVRIDDSVVMLADSPSPEWAAVEAHVHIYVPDVDAVYQRAVAAGAISVQEPIKKTDADKRGGVKDAGGTTWWIATMVEPRAS